MVHKFDIEKAELLDDPDRIQFLNPDSILEIAKLGREMIFADLGCGTGYFAIPASWRVKKVYALDVQQEMLDILRGKIKTEKITNIETILSEESAIPLPDGSVDVLFMANVFHELEDRNSILKEGRRVLSGKGKLIIVDWKKIEMDFGPPLEERVTAGEVTSICKDNGFIFQGQENAGPYNYLLIFKSVKEMSEKKPDTGDEGILTDKYSHEQRPQYDDIDDLIKKSMEDRKKRRLKQLGR